MKHETYDDVRDPCQYTHVTHPNTQTTTTTTIMLRSTPLVRQLRSKGSRMLSSVSYEHILTERRGKVGWITLNRPKALNGTFVVLSDSAFKLTE